MKNSFTFNVRYKTIVRVCLFLFLLTIYYANPVTAQKNNPVQSTTIKELKILYINSYDKQYEWSREILHGISDRFDEGGYKINITEISLFSKTVLSEEDRLHILESQINALKFTNLDFIIASDSEASAIIFKSKSDIFHKIPVLLCSVPDFSIHSDFDNISVAVKSYSYDKTFLMAKKLFPATDTVYIVTDNSVTGAHHREISKLQLAPYANQCVIKYFGHSDTSVDDMIEFLSNLSNNTFVIWGLWSRDNSTNFKSPSDYFPLFSGAAAVPIFTVVDWGLNKGQIAGYLTRGYDQGYVVAGMALDLIKDSVRSLSPQIVKTKGKIDTQFLDKWKISHKNIPDDINIINPKPTFFQANRTLIVYSLGTLVLILLLVLYVLYKFMSKYKKQLIITSQLIKEKDKVTKELMCNEMILKEAIVKAEESDRLKSAFLANMSHEIRTPLNAIVGFSNLIAYAESTEEIQDYIKVIETNNDLLLQLINDILDLSKIEAGKLELNMGRVDVFELLNNLMQMYSMRVKDDVRIILDTPECKFSIISEKNRLSQVITNFLNNAIKFTQKGIIRLGCNQKEEGLYFYVTDTGKGIAEENIPKVFDRFSKFDSFSQGNGLGLSISKSIILKLGGTIGVESVLGKGSTFWFILPINDKASN